MSVVLPHGIRIRSSLAVPGMVYGIYVTQTYLTVAWVSYCPPVSCKLQCLAFKQGCFAGIYEDLQTGHFKGLADMSGYNHHVLKAKGASIYQKPKRFTRKLEDHTA